MSLTFTYSHDEEIAEYSAEGIVPPPWLRTGYQTRSRIVIRRDRRSRRKHGYRFVAYSKSTHGKARQLGPVPLPFRAKPRGRW